jgi:hypothetical protein
MDILTGDFFIWINMVRPTISPKGNFEPLQRTGQRMGQASIEKHWPGYLERENKEFV